MVPTLARANHKVIQINLECVFHGVKIIRHDPLESGTNIFKPK